MICTPWSTARPPRPRYTSSRRLRLEELESRRLLSATDLFSTALPLALNSSQPQTGSFGPTPALYTFRVADSGRFTAEAAPTGGATRLTLLSSTGQVLVQSDGQSPSNPNDLIDLHLSGSPTGTTYFLEVQGLGNAAGTWDLQAHFTTATPPFQQVPVGNQSRGHAFDVNADGAPDVVLANFQTGDVSVLLGRGDGTFAPGVRYPVGQGTSDVIAADLQGKGVPDLVASNYDGTVSILPGNPDGTFGPATQISVGVSASALVAGDFNGDGHLDLAVTDAGTGSVAVLLGHGDGTFSDPSDFPVGNGPSALLVADFNHDGRLDLATTNQVDSTVSVLLGNGDGTFAPTRSFAVGQGPAGLVAGDFNGDGNVDLATANSGSNDVSVLLGHGDGTFAGETRLPAGAGTVEVVAGDFNGDGHVDLATTNQQAGTLSVFRGRGDGTFQAQSPVTVGSTPTTLLVADFNQDGRLDLAHGDDNGHLFIDLGRGDATFETLPPAAQDAGPRAITCADFNRDGAADLAVADISTGDVQVLLGRKDGTFQTGGRYAAGSQPFSIGTGDFNQDGIPDLVVCNLLGNSVTVLLGQGDGTFGSPQSFAAGATPTDVITGDFNGDGHLDLAVTNPLTGNVSILDGAGDGTFSAPRPYAAGSEPLSLVAGDFNGDGVLDLATANYYSNDVSVLLGHGDGTFGDAVELPAGVLPYAVVAADFNGDGHLDLAACNSGSDSVSVFLGRGDGAFAPQAVFPAGPGASGLVVADFNGDGHADLAATNSSTDGTVNRITFLLGQGDGTFREAGQWTGGNTPLGIVSADFNGDGLADLATANLNSSDVSVLVGHGDGTFHPMLAPVPDGPQVLLSSDLNNDGSPDLVSADFDAGAVSVHLGQGDGRFRDPVTFAVGNGPRALTTGDFNRDGRADLVVANSLDDTVSILLGIGDGTFTTQQTYAVGSIPDAIVSADFNGDGLPDLAVANFGSGSVSILLGNRDGTFRAGGTLAVGAGPDSLALGDVNGDGVPDLVVGDALCQDVRVLLGNGDGTFRVLAPVALDAAPEAIVTGDFNGDGRLDVAVACQASGNVFLLLGQGGGSLQAPLTVASLTAPGSLAAGDFNNDGRLDLAVADSNAGTVSVLLGQGDGTFAAQASFGVGRYPLGLVAGDFNDDGRLDLATANGLGQALCVALGMGDGTLTDVANSPLPRPAPIVTDLNGDGIPDVVVLRQDGQILFRPGLAGQSGVFGSPVVINPDPAWAARDFTVARVNGHNLLLAIDARSNSDALYADVADHFVRIYVGSIPTFLPFYVLAGDVNGDGIPDMVTCSAATGQVLVALQRPVEDLSYRPWDYQIDVGTGISSLALVDVNGDGLPDIVATFQTSGEVCILLNSKTDPFSTQLRFRAGNGLVNLEQDRGFAQVESPDTPVAVVAGLFDGGTQPALAVLNSGAHRVDLLPGDGQGGVLDPSPARSFLTGLDPVAMVTADFNGDGLPDLAVLNRGSDDLTILLGDGQGGFTEQLSTGLDGSLGRVSVGDDATGLAVADLNGDGQLDLLVGNAEGDVLIVYGNGDGTFRPYQRIDQHVALAVGDVNGDGRQEFAFADQAQDRVAFQSAQPGQSFQQDRHDGVLDPNAIQFADLNGDAIPDLIVANGGGNNVLVYPGVGDGRFAAAQRFFVGTDPAGITISDVNGDGIPDLVVANKGSNDVSLLFGSGRGSGWTLVRGPRLQVGEGPVATVARDVNGDGIPDLLVANSISDNVYLLPGLGQGFFDDRNPVVYQTGSEPTQLFVGPFDTSPGLDLVTVNEGSSDLTFISNLSRGAAATPLSLSTGGGEPMAAVAGNFGGTGTSDLIVANRDGQVSLLQGGVKGLQVMQVLSSGLVNVSDLAWGGISGSVVELYATVDGQAQAFPVTFTLEQAPVVPVEPGTVDVPVILDSSDGSSPFLPPAREPPEAERPPSAGGQVTALSSSPESHLEVLATLHFGPPGLPPAAESRTEGGEVVALGTLGPAPREVSGAVYPGGEEESGVPAVPADEATESSDRERNAVITGTADAPVKQYLSNPGMAAPSAVPFRSPLDAFDSGVEETRPADPPAQPAPAEAEDVAATPDRDEESEPGSPPQPTRSESRVSGEPVLDPAGRIPPSDSLLVLAVGLLLPFLGQERPPRRLREDSTPPSRREP